MTTQTIAPDVTEGAVLIESVSPLILHEDVEVWEIDARSKYASVLEVGIGPSIDDDTEMPRIVLYATSETLRTDPTTAAHTTITFAPRKNGERWGMLLDGGRYTFIVTLYRHPAPDDDSLLDLTWRAEN